MVYGSRGRSGAPVVRAVATVVTVVTGHVKVHSMVATSVREMVTRRETALSLNALVRHPFHLRIKHTNNDLLCFAIEEYYPVGPISMLGVQCAKCRIYNSTH